MNLPRRQFLYLTAGAAACPAVMRGARAQSYPARPVRIIVGFTAGSSTDITARLLAQWLSDRLAGPFVVENRPGAGTNIATEAVVRAPADGYTLLLVGTPNAISATLYEKLSFNFLRDIAPVASIARIPLVMLVNPANSPKTVREFVAYAKTRRGKVNMATGGVGSLPHLCGELFNVMAGVEMVPVHYRGAALALSDLLGGEVQVIFETVPSAIGHIRDGRLRAVAVTTAARLEVLPDVPTIGETLQGYDVSGWQGIGAPRNTPAEIIDKLHMDINAALADPRIKARVADLGGSVFSLSPAEFGKYIAGETEKWANVIRTANIKPE